MLWLYQLPLWLLCCVVVLPGIAMSMIGLYVVRSRGLMLSPDDNSTAGFAHAFIGVLYAVALGLMVVGVQGSFSEVDSAVMNEANLAGDMYRDIEGLAEPMRSQLQDLLLA
ncbi:MAG: hypothetical protein AAB211_11375, partial [Pseudomonadota bacterium]